jgi:hypothetical protein
MLTLLVLIRRFRTLIENQMPSARANREILEHIARFEVATNDRLAEIERRVADCDDTDDRKEA